MGIHRVDRRGRCAGGSALLFNVIDIPGNTLLVMAVVTFDVVVIATMLRA